jgi:Mn2+/Fe2+ NRAMP family transporter
MAVLSRGESEERFSPDVPGKVLPRMPLKDLPEAPPLKRVIGPGVVLVATALGSGEYVIWPFVASNLGLTVLWAAVVAVAIQFFINMEVERYTLATGETAITGFTRMWRPWWFLFVLMAIVPNVWPGLAIGAATCLSFIVGGLDVTLVGVLGLLAIGLTLTASPVVYRTVEKLQTVIIGGVVIWLVIAIFAGTTADAWGDFVKGFGSFGSIPFGEDEAVTAAVIAGAIAFAGSGGCGNLAVSNWVRDKGMGMGHYVPRIVSPFSGEQEAAPSTGVTFEPTDENLKRWRSWWRVSNAEQAITFWLIGTAGIVILSVLAYSTLFGQQTGEDFDFIEKEGQVLKEVVAPWFGTLFWIAGFFKLLSTTLGNFDYVSRITGDAVKINATPNSRFWTESRIYAATVWLLVLVGIVILLTITEQPLLLIVISSAMSAVVMFIYSILLIVMNRSFLPAMIRLSGYRLWIMGFAILWFGYFSVRVIIEYGGQLF